MGFSCLVIVDCIEISIDISRKKDLITHPRKSSLIVPMALIAATSGFTPRIFRRRLVPFSITWSA